MSFRSFKLFKLFQFSLCQKGLANYHILFDVYFTQHPNFVGMGLYIREFITKEHVIMMHMQFVALILMFMANAPLFGRHCSFLI